MARCQAGMGLCPQDLVTPPFRVIRRSSDMPNLGDDKPDLGDDKPGLEDCERS